MKEKFKYYIKLVKEKGVVAVFSGTFLIKLLAFFGSIVLVRVLSKFEYGVLGYIENIYSYVYVIAGFGVSNAILRYVVLAEDRQEKYNRFCFLYKLGLGINIALVAIVAVANNFYPHKEKYLEYVWLIPIMTLMLPFQYITDNVLLNERAHYENKVYARMAVILSGSVIACKILSGAGLGITGLVICQTCLYVILGVAFFYYTKKRHYIGLKPLSVDSEEKKTMTSYSVQYMITNGLWTIFMLNDTFLIGRYLSPETLAEYKVAYTIPGCVAIIASAIGIVIVPYFIKNEQDKKWVWSNYKKIFLVSAVGIGVVCLAIIALTKPIIYVLYGETYMNIVPVMRILVVAAFINNGLRYTTANILAAMGKIKYNMLVSALGIVLQLGINLLIIQKYGEYGVAITSCVVYAFMAVLISAIFVKKYRYKGE